MKYEIILEFEALGFIEKNDVIGALFNTTEGLFNDLDFNDLAKQNKIGRIDVQLNTVEGKTNGTITIPSDLDQVYTVMVAAMIETVSKIGSSDVKIKTISITDTRIEEKKKLIDRAKELLIGMEK